MGSLLVFENKKSNKIKFRIPEEGGPRASTPIS
jgi:hypothetical protein